jgi:plasmid stabilization system protein ParE
MDAAVAIDERFADAIARLAGFPHSGKPGLVEGTRNSFLIEATVSSTKFRGTVCGSLRWVHTARQWPPLTGE